MQCYYNTIMLHYTYGPNISSCVCGDGMDGMVGMDGKDIDVLPFRSHTCPI